MSIHTPGIESDWQWRRVVGWSGSVSAHVAACVLLLLPLTEPLLRSTQVQPPPTLVELHEQAPPPPPRPAEPIPPPRSKPVRAPVTPAPTRSEPPSAIEAPMAVAPAMVPASVSSPVARSDTPAPSSAPQGAGATQTLAYAGALRAAYPPASARAREQGRVLLRVLVDATGSVQDVRIERSSGHARLDAAAREAVLRGRFRPVMRDGEAIPAWGLVPIEFRLDRA